MKVRIFIVIGVLIYGWGMYAWDVTVYNQSDSPITAIVHSTKPKKVDPLKFFAGEKVVEFETVSTGKIEPNRHKTVSVGGAWCYDKVTINQHKKMVGGETGIKRLGMIYSLGVLAAAAQCRNIKVYVKQDGSVEF